jgi:hypothetical protein
MGIVTRNSQMKNLILSLITKFLEKYLGEILPFFSDLVYGSDTAPNRGGE